MKITSLTIAFFAWMLMLSSCMITRKSRIRNFQYEDFKAGLPAAALSRTDSSNVFDSIDFTGKDSLHNLLLQMDSVWKKDLSALKATSKKTNGKTTLKEEINAVNENIKSLAAFNKATATKGHCTKLECPLVAEIVKSKQLMYLYVGGEIKDSFAVSTGVPGRETPDMNLRAAGPVFVKYTSTRYPEGDYKGLGNMPYAVFVKGGYAIHGTTAGNFSRLGKKASHGCIRLHPDHAKLFYELVQLFGLNNTWVIVR